MDKIKVWYMTYESEITWFIIGYMISLGLSYLACEDYVNSGICFFIAFLNYKLD